MVATVRSHRLSQRVREEWEANYDRIRAAVRAARLWELNLPPLQIRLFEMTLGERGGFRNHRQAVIVAARAAGLPPSARDADPALRAVYPEAGPAAATDPAFRDDVRGNGS